MDIGPQNEDQPALRALLHWLAHELNNPLGVVLGHLQRLVRHAEGADREALLAVQRNARRCADLARAITAAAQLPSLAPTGDALIAEVAALLPPRPPEDD